jgi:hypothetical protein
VSDDVNATSDVAAVVAAVDAVPGLSDDDRLLEPRRERGDRAQQWTGGL